MKAKHDKFAQVTVEFNSQCEAILSPDKTQKLLPCDVCGALEWKGLNVVSFACQPCVNSKDCPACAGKIGDHSQFCQFNDPEQEPVIDDTVKCCPDCEAPNQFGELCGRCNEDRRLEGLPA